MKRTTQLATLTAAGLLAGSAFAATTPVTITNFSFETPDATDGNGRTEIGFNTNLVDLGTEVTGWTLDRITGDVSGGAGTAYGVSDSSTGDFGIQPLPSPFAGRQVFWANLDNNGTTQAVAHLDSDSLGTLAANTIYTLDVAAGIRGATNGWDASYEIGLVAGGVELGTFSSKTLIPGTNGNTPIEIGTYVLNTQTAPTGVGDDLFIRIRFTNPDSTSGDFTQIAIDNVRLTTEPVPEPGSLALLGMGGLCLLKRRRRA